MSPDDAVSLGVDLDAVEVELAKVEGSLRRLDDATYGLCDRCSQPIDDDLLTADPLAQRCRSHGAGD